jgi:hypothetical protein
VINKPIFRPDEAEALRSVHGRQMDFDEGRSFALRHFSSYTRLPAILALRSQMHRKQWLKLLGTEWCGFDNVAAYRRELTQILKRLTTEDLHQMMTAAAVDQWQSLPDSLIVFRGCYAANHAGLSWSLDRQIASGFPFLNRYRRFGDTALLLTGAVLKSRVLVIVERDEFEVVSAQVSIVSEEQLSTTVK